MEDPRAQRMSALGAASRLESLPSTDTELRTALSEFVLVTNVCGALRLPRGTRCVGRGDPLIRPRVPEQGAA